MKHLNSLSINLYVFNNINISSQIIYFRVRNINTNAFVVGQFQIVVNVRPETTTILGNYVLCSSNSGYETFNLDTLILGILGGSSSGLNSVNFYTSQADAEAATNMITNPTSYVNQVIWTQTIYARVTTIATGCYGVVSFQIVVLPSPVISNLSGITVCDADSNPNNGTTAVDLTMQSSQIMAQQSSSASNYSVSYYTTQASAQQGTSPIIPATNYVGNDGQTIWCRVENTATGCIAISSFNLNVINPAAPIVQLPNYPPYNLCDTNGANGYEYFDLSSQISNILSGQAGMIVSFYPSYSDAQNNVNEIVNLNYINTTIYVQTLGIRVTNSCSGNYSISTMDIRVIPSPVVANLINFYLCYLDSNPANGVNSFDVTDQTAQLLDNQALPENNYSVSYYTWPSDANAGVNAINTSNYTPINGQTISLSLF